MTVAVASLRTVHHAIRALGPLSRPNGLLTPSSSRPGVPDLSVSTSPRVSNSPRTFASPPRTRRHSMPMMSPSHSRTAVLTPMSTSPWASQQRHSSHSPLGMPPDKPIKKITLPTLAKMHARGEPITMVTAHDFPSGMVADHAGIEMVLVGDSLAMVALGMEDTSEVIIEEMLLHCRSVSRAVKGAVTIGDLPMGSYEVSPEQALETAIRFRKDGRVTGVKLEGGMEMAPSIARIAAAGIPVLAHVGLTPQRQASLGGFKVQGKTVAGALQVLRDALAVQEAGAFAVVLEAIPAEVAALVTTKLRIPTIGIGAGNGCSGQVLVQADMIGNFPPGRFLPKFVKQYGNVWAEARRSIDQYKEEVKARSYPSQQYTYPMPAEEFHEFERLVADTPRAESTAA